MDCWEQLEALNRAVGEAIANLQGVQPAPTLVDDALVIEEVEDTPASSLDAFAVRVLEVGQHAPAWGGIPGHFRSVYISTLWQFLGGELPEWTLENFKGVLLEAHRAGLLKLARADLVAAMDPHELAISEIRDGTWAYHFLEVTP